jgi:hypothetical protein
MKIIFLLFLPLLVHSDILVEFANVPTTSFDMVALCESVTTLYVTVPVSTSYCTTNSNFDVGLLAPIGPVLYSNMEIDIVSVKLKGITSNTTLMTFPSQLNTTLVGRNFFTKLDGMVKIISNVNDFKPWVLGVLISVLIVAFFTLLLMLHLTSALCC